jgi:Na+-driven multidrug efflux pump
LEKPEVYDESEYYDCEGIIILTIFPAGLFLFFSFMCGMSDDPKMEQTGLFLFVLSLFFVLITMIAAWLNGTRKGSCNK